jgi:pyruvate dehydrogenase E1 component alpha subunit
MLHRQADEARKGKSFMDKVHDVSIYNLSPERAEELLNSIGQDQALSVLETMYTIRAFEEKAEELYSLGKTHGTMHLSIGQEASAVGACLALRPDDYILSTHRGHGHCIAKGAELNRMMAEFFGKEAGYCRGRGGSMHIADVSRNNLGANSIVAGGIPMAVGVGLKHQKQRHRPGLFGDLWRQAAIPALSTGRLTWRPSGTCR